MTSAGLAQSQCSVTIASSTNITCYGMCDGSATLTSVGTPNFTYLWSPGGQTVANPTNLCVGTNTVVMTDGSSCSAAVAITITEPYSLSATSTQTNMSACDSSCSGTAAVNILGGTSPFTHQWNTFPPQFTASAIGLCAATYTDIITDANGCSTSRSVTISQASSLSNFLEIVNTSGAIMCDGGANASVSGGVGPYTYLWTPGGQTTPSISGQCPGMNYSVCITDANGCQICDSFAISPPNGVKEIDDSSQISVFPNPSTGIFSVNSGLQLLNSDLSISTMLGEQVYSSRVESSRVDIDLSNLKQGIYVVKLSNNNRYAVKQIIIER